MPRAVIALLVLAACFDPPPPSNDEYIESHTESFDIPAYPPPQLDLLLVVDDRPAITPYRTHIGSFGADLVAQLRQIYGGMPNMHIAVTTTTTHGTLRTVPAMSGAFIADALEFDGSRPVNYQGTLDSAMAALLDAGDSAAGTNAPLESMMSAVTAPTGFFRTNAYLAVIAISASDDASAGADYISALKSVHSDPSDVIVSGIYPASSPRLDAFFNGFPNRSTMVSIDAIDWTNAYSQISQLTKTTLGLRCMVRPADVDPSTPGNQHDCRIAWRLDDGIEHVMPECMTNGPRPCWSFVDDPNNCFQEYVLFRVDGFADPYHPAIRGECVVK
jgi:hypothetical protein